MKRVILLVAAVALVAVPGASAKTWKLHGLGLAIVLPHRWLQKTATPGWRFEAAVPSTGTGVFINAFPAAQDPGGTFHHDLIVFETNAARRDDTHAIVASRGTIVAGEKAIEIVGRYAGLTAYLYGFRHGVDDYTLEFLTRDTSLAQSKAEFRAALSSLQFLG